jgi:hypothetical protein
VRHGPVEVVGRLKAQPGVGAAAERLVEADRHLRRDARAAVDDVGHCLRLTPSFLAASVTLSPKGSRQSWWTESPGCGGFFIGMAPCSLVVVDQVRVYEDPVHLLVHLDEVGVRDRRLA